jgi:predicted O-linked N-acetylglucosamine transferase (SPINDLY family)
MTQPQLQHLFEQAIKAHQAGEAQAAASLYLRVLEDCPQHVDATHNLGLIDRAQGRLESAIGRFRQVLLLQPDHALAHISLGATLAESGDYDQAIQVDQRAIELAPDLAAAWGNLGNALRDAGRGADAVRAYRRAISRFPRQAPLYASLGVALLLQKSFDEAIRALEQALALQPNFPEAWHNLGNALFDIGRHEKGIAAIRQALRIKPDFADAMSSLALHLHYLSAAAPAEIYQAHALWNQRFAQPLATKRSPHSNVRDVDRTLRVGYVSADFRDHAVARFLMPLISHHSTDQFKLFAYSNVQKVDALTERFRPLFHDWRNIFPLSDQMAADLIRGDQIDILVDLSGHTAGNRLGIFARKPAPVAITYLGYPDTTGLDSIDYRFTDSLADPPGLTEHLHSERLVRLDPCAWSFDPLVSVPLERKASETLTFGCFSNFAKVNPPLLELWCQILRSTPDSRLLLKFAAGACASACQHVAQIMQKHGVAASRICFQPMTDGYTAHLARYNDVDIALDTFPYHGTTTTCEALWMGVPVVSLAGSTHVSRVGVSLLQSAGLGHLVAQSPQEYVSIAHRLAADRARLRTLHKTLRTVVERSPLMDHNGFARRIESAYRVAWRSWCGVNSA